MSNLLLRIPLFSRTSQSLTPGKLHRTMLQSILLLVFYFLSASALSINITVPLQRTPVLCFDRQPRIVAPDFIDCQLAINRVIFGPQASIPRTWHRPQPSSRIIGSWVSRTCMVALVSDTVEAQDVFAPNLIAIAASEIVDSCVMHHDHLGGKKAVGPKEMFYVTVSGELAPDLGTQLAATA